MSVRVAARSRPAAARPESAVESLASVVREVPALFHRLRATAARLHRQGEASAGRRGILFELAGEGPRTVPQMARARPVSRQHIQVLVNGLAADGLVERVENPAHRRSPLWQLSPRGARRVQAMAKREAEALGRLAVRLDAADLAVAARTLARLREAIGALERDAARGRRRR